MIRKFLISLSLLTVLGSQAATKHNEYFSIDNVTLNADGEGEVIVSFNTEYAKVNGIQMDFYFPEGFEIEKNSRSGKYVVNFYNGDEEDSVTYDHNASVGYNKASDDSYFFRIVGISTSNTFVLPGYHPLFHFNIIAPEGFKQPAEVTVSNIIVGGNTEDPVSRHCDNVTFTVIPDIATGIDEIELPTVSEDEIGAEEEIFDINGFKVSRPLAPGIYIINGEKVLIP